MDANDHGLMRSMPPVLNQMTGKNWAWYHGDCVEVMRGLPDGSIDFSMYSPPFASLYVYSNSDRDMGNVRNYEEFRTQYAFLLAELFRATKPGRLSSVHCMNIPLTIQRHGHIGIMDFRGDIIREHVAAGWVFHSEVVIWKNAATEVQRTKTIGLLHKQLLKDSCMSRMAMPDYVCTFRKPGKNMEPVAGPLDRFIGEKESFKSTNQLSVDTWQRYASPVWFDIDQTRTLQHRTAREENDERHICPLQLDVIERCLELWSNEGDLVLSPFGGIASEGYCSIMAGRKFIGVELKESYWKHGAANLANAEKKAAEVCVKLPGFDEDDGLPIPVPAGSASVADDEAEAELETVNAEDL